MKEKNVEFKEILNIFKKRWYILAISIVLFGGLAFLTSSKNENIMIYTGTMKLFVAKNEEVRPNEPLTSITVKSYLEILRSKSVVEKSIKAAGSDESLDYVWAKLSLGIQNDSQIINLQLRGEDRDEITAILNELYNVTNKVSETLLPEGKIYKIEDVNVPNNAEIEGSSGINIVLLVGCGIVFGIGAIFALEFLKNRKK